MIELLENEKLFKEDKTSSKGNQMKFFRDDYYYKIDKNGYEGLSEYVVSKLLYKSTLGRNEFVDYELETIKYKNVLFNGCKSKNFLKENEKLITLERLYNNYSGHSLHEAVRYFDTLNEKIRFVCETVSSLTGIRDFEEYFSKMMIIDSVFLNDDRHFHNIALIVENNVKYKLCPIFDNGASLLSDTTIDYPFSENHLDLIRGVKSKTFNVNFNSVLEAVEKEIGLYVDFTFCDDDIDTIINEIKGYEKEKERVRKILKAQRNKLKYYFS